MNSAFSAPTGQAAYAPLQPTADTVNVPQGLDSNAPGHTHPQNASNVTQDPHAATGLKSHPPTGAYGDSAATGYGAQQQQQQQPLHPTGQAPHASQGLTGGALGHNSDPQYGTGATHDIPGATGYQSHPANDSTGYQSQSVNDSTTTGGGYGAHPTSHGLDVGAPGHTPIPQHAQDHHTATHPKADAAVAATTGYAAYQDHKQQESNVPGSHVPGHGQDAGATGYGTGQTHGLTGATGHAAGQTNDSGATGYGTGATGHGTGTTGYGTGTTGHGTGLTHGAAGAAGYAADQKHGLPGTTGHATGQTHGAPGTTGHGSHHPLAAAPITAGHGYHDDNTSTGGDIVLQVSAPDLHTIQVSGHGTGYTMTTSSEGNKRLVTIRRGLAGTGTDGTTTTTTGAYNETEDDTQTEDDPPVAQVELHQIRSSKISIKGMPQIKLKDWLGGRGTSVHKFTEAGTTYEWRKSFHGLSHKRELFSANDDKTRLAWAEKVGTTSETGKPHEPGMPPMPANPGTATLTVSRRAQPIIEMVIVSFLLVDRESREQ